MSPDEKPSASSPLSSPASDLEAAASAKERGAIRDLLAFMGENKKWWLTPIIVVLLLLGCLLLLASSGAAPFLYPLF